MQYLSDVERDARPPLSDERIGSVAEFLEADLEQLLGAAAEARGVYELDAAKVGPLARRIGAALMFR